MNTFDRLLLDTETERLRLRPLNAGDEALYCEIYTDPATMRFIAPPLSLKQAASSFRKVVVLQGERTLSSRFLVIEEKAGENLVGICGTSKYEAEARRVEVGIILKAEAGARGLAREALGAMMRRIFAVSATEEIWAEYSIKHFAAERLVSTVGFTPCQGGETASKSLSNRVWSVHRSSWYASQVVN